MSMLTSSMPMAVTGTNDSGFGGGGAWLAVILVALLGGRGGWGGGCGGDSSAELNGRFNSIETQIDNLGNREDLARTLMSVCETQRDVIESKFELSQEINQNRFDAAIGFKDVELQIAQCCCTTNTNIEALRGEIKEQALQNRIQVLEDRLSQTEAKPAYITYAPGQSYFPPYNAVGAPYGYGYGACGNF